eukprot:scaffold189765_cov36-Tisochrysis_lutea.AAC.3
MHMHRSHREQEERRGQNTRGRNNIAKIIRKPRTPIEGMPPAPAPGVRCAFRVSLLIVSFQPRNEKEM